MRLRLLFPVLVAGLLVLPACARRPEPRRPVANLVNAPAEVDGHGPELIGVQPREALGKPRLVVLVVFDQMRGDYLERWRPLLTGGFNRMLQDGAWFTDCHYPYAMTATGPGHASMLTGCSPDRHGIVGNDFVDRARGTRVYCATTELDRPVPTPAETPKAGKPLQGGSPRRLLTSTVGDVLKQAHPGARVIGLSLKDRSAVLPVGHKADGAYWLDGRSGRFITSSYYRDSLPGWVEAFDNDRGTFDRWYGKAWTRLDPALDYAQFSGPDDQPGKSAGVTERSGPGEKPGFRQGRTFPHPMGPETARPGPLYYDCVVNSPFGNDLLLDLTRAALDGERLGQDDVPDLLSVSFSSNDYVGHAWGPDSQEVLDVTLRSDRMMGELLRTLDDRVGPGRYVIVMTADHGICPLPEVSRQKGLDAGRVALRSLVDGAKAHLREAFGTDAATGKGDWILEPDGVLPPWICLNQRLIEHRGLNPDDVAASLADHLRQQPAVERAWTARELRCAFPPHDPIGLRMQRSYRPDRCGDVGFLLKPYYLFSDLKQPTGTNHGTPYPYDTHVPLVVFGPNIRPGVRRDPVAPQAAAAICAHALGIRPPDTAEYPTPTGLFK